MRLSARRAIVRGLVAAGLELPAQYLSFDTKPYDQLDGLMIPGRKARVITGQQISLLRVLYLCGFSMLRINLADEGAFEALKASE